MLMEKKRTLSDHDVSIINAALSANMRVEIVATDSGIKIYNVKRHEMNKRPMCE